MANGHGGHRTPSKPAPVSGPGSLSKRTDGGPSQVVSTAPGQDYGDAKQQAMAQRTAPMGAAQPLPKAPSGGEVADSASMPQFAGLPFSAPSERPGEPVTHGVDIGEGAGSDALNLPAAPDAPQPDGYLTNLLAQMSPNDTTGTLGKLYVLAKQRGA